MNRYKNVSLKLSIIIQRTQIELGKRILEMMQNVSIFNRAKSALSGQSRGDVPGWVLVVLMTTALVTGIWSIAAPKLTAILRNSLDAMSGIK
jgi:hypothetical protein